MEKHVRTLGILHIVYSSVSFILGIAIFLLLSGIGITLKSLPESEEMSVSISSLILFIGFLAGLTLLIFSLLGIIGGIGLLKHREWARIVALIIGFFELLHVPVGTALGIYTIWVLFNSQAIPLFRKSAAVPFPRSSQR